MGGPNEAYGLMYFKPGWKTGEPTLRIISSQTGLREEFGTAQEPKLVKCTDGEQGRIMLEVRNAGDEVFPFSECDLQHQKRLADRLEVSRTYERKLKRMRREVGLPAAEKRRDKACDQYWKAYHKIFATPATTPPDLILKLKAYDEVDESYEAEGKLIRDLHRLVNSPKITQAQAA